MTGLSPELIADSVVTLASLIGLALFAQVLRMQRPRTTVTNRFLFAIQVVAALLAIRLVQWLTGVDWIGRLTFAVAGLVPLATLLVAEALLRRHAPLALKVWAAGGAVFFALVAVVARADHGLLALISLAVFQVIAFVAMSIFVMGRDRQSLSIAENTMIDRLSLSLVLIVPLAMTDFRTPLLDLPVRLSGIAILAMCWLGLTLRRSDAAQSEVISVTAALAVGLVFASLCIMELAALDVRTTVQVMALVVSVGLLALIFNQNRLIRREDKVGRVLDVLADTSLTEHDAFLEALQTRALTSGALILDTDGLRDFDAAFEEHFTHQTLVSSEDLQQMKDPQLAEQFAWFFRKFEASHVMLVSKNPFRVMALNVPTLAQSRQLEQELRIAQRIAALLAERGASHG
ncbi:hypothetical protein [Cognatiyoonia sp. IB215182]|uniref:hypothetical protein n=1 Tax=Cognatiyoonia sp. IB215182 TaxID=3097353 RepID=UPI002A13B4E5|nr:hypothetical protein [Cognatiyoonia sp. IB215182]MDX8352995.1 hypothetical protein [Cognatiyoonia sp. IB215182]